MTFKKVIAPILAFVLIIAVLFGLNVLTAPVIAENESASLMGPLAQVLPGAKDLKELDLSGLPGTVSAIYEEGAGLGYSVKLSTSEGYTKNPIEFALGVSPDGKVTGLQIMDYPDTKDVTEDFLTSFTDKDSALSGVDLVSGATYSSSAIRNAVSDALNYMVDAGMITAGVKSDEQILKELLPSVFPGIANADGILQISENSPENVMLAINGSGAAAVFEKDGASYLQILNINGDVKTFDVEGKEVSADKCDALASVKLASTADEDKGKIATLAGDGAVLEEIPLEGVFSCVTSAFKITTADETYYGFGTRPYAYSNEIMPVYFILTEDGAISRMTAPEFILHGEYYNNYTLDKDAYKASFEGKTAGTFTDDDAFISAGATMSSVGIAMATNAAFDALSSIGGAAA